MKRSIAFVFVLGGLAIGAHAQAPPSDSLDLFALSLEELMNVRIVSASKSDESLFNAPVTSFVITRKDIINSGATSIPDALRMAPALIVREMANGSYDVSIRGGKDNLSSHKWWNLNTSILAMIDNRVVFNHYSGGTYWQNLPVDLADVERIEIVYGPNAPLYGPNAVDGVIHIITRRRNGGEDLYGSATLQAGESVLFTALGGKRINDQLEVNISVNHSNRKRAEVEYYDSARQAFIADIREHSDTILAANPRLVYPNPETGSRRTGINLNLFYKPLSDVLVTLSSSLNESSSLVGSTTASVMQHFSNSSMSHMLKVETGGLTFQSTAIMGRQGTYGVHSEYSYDYTTLDYYLDYDLKIGSNLSFRPSLSFQNAVIDDEPYTVDVNREGLFNNKAAMHNYAFSIKGDYKPFKPLRVIAAVRADKFKAPDDTYVSYQAIVNYKTHADGILRLLAGRSYAGSFIENTYMDWTPVDDNFFRLSVLGNENARLLQNNILEAGYRVSLRSTLSLDLSVFRQTYSDFIAPVLTVVKDPSPAPPFFGAWEIGMQNIELRAEQRGATLAATIVMGNAKLTPSVTWQQTLLSRYSPYYTTPHPFYSPEKNIENVTDKESDYAPDVFGGFTLNMPVRKWNFNISGYYYSRYVLDGLNSVGNHGEITEPAIGTIHGKVLLNVNAGVSLAPDVKAFVNARNVLGQSAREAYGTDRIGRMILAGIHIEF